MHQKITPFLWFDAYPESPNDHDTSAQPRTANSC